MFNFAARQGEYSAVLMMNLVLELKDKIFYAWAVCARRTAAFFIQNPSFKIRTAGENYLITGWSNLISTAPVNKSLTSAIMKYSPFFSH